MTLLATMAAPAVAADGRRSATSQPERMARARWQPVRQTAGTAQRTSTIRRAQATESMPIEGEVIMTPAPVEAPFGYEGTIVSGPGFHGMPCDGAGCDGCGGVGCDSASFCDSPGCGGACGSPGCVTICLPRDGWFSAEYLLWYQDGMDLPPLVTRSPAGTSPVLPGADVIYGGSDYLDDSLDGVRLNFGIWLDPRHRWAVQAEYFGLETISDSFSADGDDGLPSIGRPFGDVSEAGVPEAARIISQTGISAGSVAVDIESELRGAGVQLRRNLISREGCGDTFFCNVPLQYRSRLDVSAGYRFMQLEEGLGISDVFERATAPTGDFRTRDQFDTRTQFNGLDLGIYYERQRGLWSLDLRGRFALGTNRQKVSIAGSTSEPAAAIGGLLAQETNIGNYSRDRISVLPELGATLGYQLTPRLKATVGYTFIYWSNVVRPGDQIDTDINGSLLAEATGATVDSLRPRFEFDETDYWVQGISFGGEFCW